MADRFAVDTEALYDVVADLLRAERSLESLAAETDRVVASLEDEWEGLAAAAHQAAHREWRHGMAQMRDAVGALRAVAHDARTDYDGAACDNLSAWRQVAP